MLVRLIASFLFVALLSPYCLAQTESASPSPIERLTLFIPAAPGGGFDRTGTAIRDALLAEGLVQQVDIAYSPGAGGLIGLAQFVEARRGDPHSVLICGKTTLGATVHNRSSVSLSDATPIARLIQPTITIIVPSDSEFQTFDDLIEIVRQDPALVTWLGGSSGSFDEIIINQIIQAYSDGTNVAQFTAVPGGGDKIIDQLVLSDLAVAASSFEEVSEAYAQGDVRILAVLSPTKLDGIDAPVLQSYGFEFPSADWRGVFAAPELTSDQSNALVQLFEQLAGSPSWRAASVRNQWQDAYLPSTAFGAFLRRDLKDIQEVSNLPNSQSETSSIASGILSRRYRWVRRSLLAIGLLLAALGGLYLFTRRQKKRMQESLDDATEQTRKANEKLERSLNGMASHINDEFDRWKLTEAENEIGWMLLKGLSFKEIAEARKRSERTVRQQARSIYAKSGLSNRSDLAAYFLEDFVFGH